MDPAPILTTYGRDYREVAQGCALVGLPAATKQFEMGQYPMSKNPASVAAWKSRMVANTPAAPPGNIPTMFVMGGQDEVVPVNTQIDIGRSYCRAGSDIRYKYYPDSGHFGEQIVDPGNYLAFVNQALVGAKSSATSLCTGPVPVPAGPSATTPTALP